MIYIQLIYNLSMLIALSVLAGFVGKKDMFSEKQKSVIQGVIFGMVAVIGMLYPVKFAPGIIFDGRSVVISLCALFFGPVSAVISGSFVTILRIFQGGAGTLPGILVVIEAALFGLIFHYLFYKKNKIVPIYILLLMGLLVHLTMLSLMLMLPADIAWKVVQTIGLPVITIYPIATILIGKIISDNLEKAQFILNLKKSEEIYRKLVDVQNKDILELKQTQEELKEKIVQYHNLANSSSALIWTAGTDKLCNYFNDTWLNFTGRTTEQEMDNGWTEGVHTDDFDRCLKTYVTAFDKREKFEMEYRLRNSKGEYRWLLDIGTPNYDAKGEFVGYIGHCFDIEDRIRSEISINKKNEELRQMNSFMVDREIKMTELKEEINGLLKEIGKESKY
jgi:PAS domain S-box-containing protein